MRKLYVLCELQGLLCAHDAVAQKDYFPRLPDIPIDVEEDEETIKIVQLVKSNEPLVSLFKYLRVINNINNLLLISFYSSFVAKS